MSKTVLTSGFPNGMEKNVAKALDSMLTARANFAFIASVFDQMQEKTDHYMEVFLALLCEKGIDFENAVVVDGRMTPEQAREAVLQADVVWLSGGDTEAEYASLQKYGLIPVLKDHKGVVIGMSAGSINLAKTAIRSRFCGHARQAVYPGIGRVDLTVEPHFTLAKDPAELLELSYRQEIIGLCDGAIITCEDGKETFYGEAYRIKNGRIEKIKA